MSRAVPRMQDVAPTGLFEHVVTFGQNLPGTLGHISYRKLKRRRSLKLPDYYDSMIADLRPGDLCIDLGDNVGEMTTRFARNGADVIAFEPDPETFERLRAATEGMGTVTLHQKAAAAEAGTLTLYRSSKYAEDPVQYSVAASLVRKDYKIDTSNGVDVEVVDFVDFLTALDRDVRILKIDIEGSEWDLLERLIAAPVLSRVDSIFVETHERFDPAAIIPVADRLHRFAESCARPYIDLYWGRNARPIGALNAAKPHE
ncbi:MAG: FkbM family methyltransferase [Pseudomonadota bacterium]